MTPAKPIGVVMRLQRHVCGEHPDAWPGCCGATYWEHGRGLALACPACQCLPEFKRWKAARKAEAHRAWRAAQRKRRLSRCLVDWLTPIGRVHSCGPHRAEVTERFVDEA